MAALAHELLTTAIEACAAGHQVSGVVLDPAGLQRPSYAATAPASTPL
jgi:hypothetical protein